MCRYTVLIQLALVASSCLYTDTLSDQAFPIESNGISQRYSNLGQDDIDTVTKTYQVNSIMFGPHCFWLRLVFFFNPFYICPPPAFVQYNVTLNQTDSKLGNRFGDFDDSEFPFSSPIDLTPAKPKRKQNIDPPPTDHRLTPTSIGNSPIDLTPAKPNREQSQTQPPPLRSTTTKAPANSSETPAVIIPVQMPTSKCGLAIFKCCKADSTTIDEACFEQVGCPGPFWDYNPCSLH